MPPGYRSDFGGVSQERNSVVGNLLAYAAIIGVLMVSVLVITFRSFRQAGIIGVVGLLSIGVGLLSLWLFSYVPLAGRRFAYLSMIMDRFSRRLIGWKMDVTMTEQLVIGSLKDAIMIRQPGRELIHHSDRGGQYAGNRFRQILKRSSIRQSMSRAGDCYDNAFMESCFGTIKTELEMTEYETVAEGERELGSYFSYCNQDRKHSSLGYQTPNQFESTHPGRE